MHDHVLSGIIENRGRGGPPLLFKLIYQRTRSPRNQLFEVRRFEFGNNFLTTGPREVIYALLDTGISNYRFCNWCAGIIADNCDLACFARSDLIPERLG